MCKCTPNIRTPFCGKPGCEWPGSKPEGAREQVPSKDPLPEGWIPLSQGFRWIADHLMLKTPEFIINNWNCKYIDARIDMRTGSMRLEPGAKPAHEREPPHCSTCGCGLAPEPAADQLATRDAMSYGSGFVRIMPDGSREHVPHHEVFIEPDEDSPSQPPRDGQA